MTLRELLLVLTEISNKIGNDMDVTVRDHLSGGINGVCKIEVINIVYRPERQVPTVVIEHNA